MISNSSRNSKVAAHKVSSWLANKQQLVFVCALMLALVMAATLAEATPVSAAGIVDGHQQSAGMNNLENLISDLMDDAGNRLKKSKLNSMRQIKQTLRFGRRSDPFMSPGGSLSEQMALEDELENASQQRQLLTAALAND